MSKISEQSLGQLINFYVVTSGNTSNMNKTLTYPKHSIIFVPKANSTTEDYVMYLTDQDGKLHNIVTA